MTMSASPISTPQYTITPKGTKNAYNKDIACVVQDTVIAAPVDNKNVTAIIQKYNIYVSFAGIVAKRKSAV